MNLFNKTLMHIMHINIQGNILVLTNYILAMHFNNTYMHVCYPHICLRIHCSCCSKTWALELVSSKHNREAEDLLKLCVQKDKNINADAQTHTCKHTPKSKGNGHGGDTRNREEAALKMSAWGRCHIEGFTCDTVWGCNWEAEKFDRNRRKINGLTHVQ